MTRSRRSAVVMTCLVLCLLSIAAFAPLMDHEEGRVDLPAKMAAESFTATIEVNVTDDVGRPVGDALVTLENNVTYTDVETDENGRLTIPGLLADTNGTIYRLSARCDGYLELGAESVEVTPFNTTWVNLTVWGGGIFGTVLSDGEPVWQANISIVQLGLNTSTAIDGTYTFEGIKSGTYSVVANASYFEPVTKTAVVTIGDYVPLHFSLVSLRGAISGMVLRMDTEEPLENASVSIKVDDYTITVTSDTDGSYHLPNIPPGIYSITVALIGFNTTTVEDVEVVSGVTTEGVDVFLQEKPTVLTGVVKSGTVLLVGANVSIVGTELYGVTDVEGVYEIRDIPAGVYTVVAALQGYDNATILNVVIERGSEFRLNINLTGKSGGAVYGIVIDASTGKFLSGVRVTLLPQRETITNINGEFQFTGLEAGNYSLVFSYDGYRPLEMAGVAVGSENRTELGIVSLEPARDSYGGFIFGFDLAHSMMILALFLTIVILAFAVVLRIRSFEAPDKAPAVYDELGEEVEGLDEPEDEEMIDFGDA